MKGPEGVLDGLSQGISGAVYEMAGGIYDLFAKPVEAANKSGSGGVAAGVAEGLKSFFARPLKGGKILVDKLQRSLQTSVPMAEEVEMGLAHTTQSAAYSEPIDISDLTPEEASIERAYAAAVKLLQWWNTVDKDGNRCLDRAELIAAMSEGGADALIERVDADGDRVLTFTELAWVIGTDQNAFSAIFS